MTAARPRYAANLSMLFADHPLLDRPRAAAESGFRYVESWWPFADTAPPPHEVEDFCACLDDAGVTLVAMNLDAGRHEFGDRGLLSDPATEQRVAANLSVVRAILRRTGCRIVNALYGNRCDGMTAADQDRLAQGRLVTVADAVWAERASVVVETLNSLDSPRYPLTDIRTTARAVTEVGRRTQAQNIGLLVDVYHLAAMGTDPASALHEFAPLVTHVQFADHPGRGRPGTGDLDFAALERALSDIGYAGYVGLEYVTSPAPEGHVIPGAGVRR